MIDGGGGTMLIDEGGGTKLIDGGRGTRLNQFFLKFSDGDGPNLCRVKK